MPAPDPHKTKSLTALAKAWANRDRAALRDNLEEYRSFAARALKLGDPLLALDMCYEALGLDVKKDARLRGKDAKLRQHYGLALARCGSTKAAQEVLRGLYRDKARDEESLGLLARTYKDIWLAETDAARKQVHSALGLV